MGAFTQRFFTNILNWLLHKIFRDFIDTLMRQDCRDYILIKFEINVET